MVYLSEIFYCAFTFLCNEDSLFTKPGFLFFQLRPKANITGESKGLLLMCRNYNNLANVTVLFIHECFYNVLSCALVPVLGYRKYLVSLKSKNVKTTASTKLSCSDYFVLVEADLSSCQHFIK